MAYLILDDNLAMLFGKDIEYSTSIVEADGGEEDRNAQWTAARRRWRLDPTDLTDEMVEKLEMHVHMTRGRWKTFLHKDRLDHNHWQVSTDTSAIQIATGDGSTTAFQLKKVYGSGDDQRSRTTTNPISGTVEIWVDGVLQIEDTDYTVDYDEGTIGFDTAPGDALAITAKFQFRNRVRFVSDTLSFSPLVPRDLLHLSSSVELREVRR